MSLKDDQLEEWRRAIAARRRALRNRRGRRDPWRNAQPAQLRQPEQRKEER